MKFSLTHYKLIDQVKGHIDLDSFLTTFSLEFGPSFDEQKQQVISSLMDNGFSKNDAEEMAYPNAIHIIASKSINKDELSKRNITKVWLIKKLKETKVTLLTRWTRELASKKTIMEALKRQLKDNLNYNDRARCFFLNSKDYDDFETSVVRFIKDFNSKYNRKQTHLKTPVFCINIDQNAFYSIQKRLRIGGTRMADGYTGTYFHKEDLFRDPMMQGRTTNRKVEFDIRIVHWESHGRELRTIKPDDVYIIGQDCFKIQYSDVNIIHLEDVSFNELGYLMGVNNDYE